MFGVNIFTTHFQCLNISQIVFSTVQLYHLTSLTILTVDTGNRPLSILRYRSHKNHRGSAITHFWSLYPCVPTIASKDLARGKWASKRTVFSTQIFLKVSSASWKITVYMVTFKCTFWRHLYSVVQMPPIYQKHMLSFSLLQFGQDLFAEVRRTAAFVRVSNLRRSVTC